MISCRISPEANTTPREAVVAEAASMAAAAHPAFLPLKTWMRNMRVPVISEILIF